MRALDLQEGERDGRQHDVMRPALLGPPLEVIAPEIVLEFAVLLLDRPAAARERHQLDERRGRREMEEIVRR